jgi:predicted metal-binding membrane protein
VIIASWGILILLVLAGGGNANNSSHASMPSMPGMNMAGMSMPGMAMPDNPSASAVVSMTVPMWTLMIAAMMLPSALPALVHVASHTYRRRRRRAVAQFAATYLLLWTLCGAVVLGILQLIRVNYAVALGLALLLAAVWQFTPAKRQALRDCHRSIPLPQHGRPALRGVLRFGILNGWACVRSCWALMLAMLFVAPVEMLFWMLPMTGLVVAEKAGRRPRRTARRMGTLFGLLGIGVLVQAGA